TGWNGGSTASRPPVTATSSRARGERFRRGSRSSRASDRVGSTRGVVGNDPVNDREASRPAAVLTREQLVARDRDDPLASFRDLFFLPDGVIYLDGNSLGPLPKATPARIARTVREEWGSGLIRSWNAAGWMDLPLALGDRIGQLIGAPAGTVAVGDSTSVNVFKLLAAALSLRPD